MPYRLKLLGVFWNKSEKRLRAGWRILIHAILVFIFTSMLLVGMMFLMLAVDAIFGFTLGQALLDTATIEVELIPMILMVLVSSATLLGVLLATLLASKFLDRRTFRDFGIKFTKAWWVDFVFGLLLGALLMGLVFLFGWVSGNVKIVGFFQPLQADIGFLAGFVQSFVFFTFVGVYEELLTRGYHLINLSEGFHRNLIGKKAAIFLAVLITSAVFGLLHIGNPNANWVSTLNITIAGIIFSLGMIFTGRLAIPIGLHITWNFFQGSVFGFPVSGMHNGATLIATEMVGPVWLTGGSFGPEAGLMGLAAMMVGGILVLLWTRRKGPLALESELAVYQSKDSFESG